MRPLPLPEFGIDQVLQTCVTAASDPVTRILLQVANAEFLVKETAYMALGEAPAFFQYPPTNSIGDLSNGDMKTIYTEELSNKKGCAYTFYSKIKNSSPYNRCPLCGLGVVYSVDHYLPKYRYTDIAITPINLVPACMDCNKLKHIRFPTNGANQLLHPYFDDFSATRCIYAQVEFVEQPVVKFYLDCAGQHDQGTEDRLKNHFDVLQLGKRYASYAGEQLVIEKINFARSFEAGGAGELLASLEEQATAYETVSRNCWQAAFYHALSDSQWFVDEGHKLIP